MLSAVQGLISKQDKGLVPRETGAARYESIHASKEAFLWPMLEWAISD